MTNRYVQIVTSLYVLMSLAHAEKGCCSVDPSCKSCMDSVTYGRCHNSPKYCTDECSIGARIGRWCENGTQDETTWTRQSSTQDETTWTWTWKTGQWTRQQSSNYSLGAMFVSLLCVVLVAMYLAYSKRCRCGGGGGCGCCDHRRHHHHRGDDMLTRENLIKDILEIYHELSQCMTIREDHSISQEHLQRQNISYLENKLRDLKNQRRGQYSRLVGLQLCLFLVQFLNS